MSALVICALFFTSLALCSDLKDGRIPNILIVTGWLAGLAGSFQTEGISGLPPCIAAAAVPILICLPLFRLRMIGAGDVKLFSVIGAQLGVHAVLRIMAVSVFCGSLLALPLLLFAAGVRERGRYLAAYLTGAGGAGRSYRRGGADRPENFHFSVAVFMAMALYAGGVI